MDLKQIANIIPTLIMVEGFLAVPLCAIAGMWGAAVYWFGVGLVSLAVIYLM